MRGDGSWFGYVYARVRAPKCTARPMIDPMTVNSAKARSDVTRSARLIH